MSDPLPFPPVGRFARSADNGGAQPPEPPEVSARIAKLEAIADKTGERLAGIEVRLAKLETRADTFATKADVAEAKNSIIMWVVSAVLLAQLLPAILKRFGL